MIVLERLKLELGHKQYFTDEEYMLLLAENDLCHSHQYNKETMQRNLLLTVRDVFNMLINDIDLFRKLQDDATGFSQSSAYKLLAERIKVLEAKIDAITPIYEDAPSDVHLIFTRRR